MYPKIKDDIASRFRKIMKIVNENGDIPTFDMATQGLSGYSIVLMIFLDKIHIGAENENADMIRRKKRIREIRL